MELYKYPNTMKRNARHRGHRESEKVLSDHQEQIYDIRQLTKDLESIAILKDTTINSWFNGSEMIQLSGNSFGEDAIGIYELKRRMQEIDERIAEAERRYREYENAYE